MASREADDFRVWLDLPCVRVVTRGDRLTITAQGGRVDTHTVDEFVRATGELVREPTAYRALWDVRALPMPSFPAIMRGTQWCLGHRGDLDAGTRCLAVVVAGDGWGVRGVVDAALRQCGPRCPILVTASEDEAKAFVARS